MTLSDFRTWLQIPIDRYLTVRHRLRITSFHKLLYREFDNSLAGVPFTHQVIIDMYGLIELFSPDENSVSVEFICETFRIRICSPIETISIAPTNWCVQIEINSMADRVIGVCCWWNHSATYLPFTAWKRLVHINRNFRINYKSNHYLQQS